jgi:hypothetical protein
MMRRDDKASRQLWNRAQSGCGKIKIALVVGQEGQQEGPAQAELDAVRRLRSNAVYPVEGVLRAAAMLLEVGIEVVPAVGNLQYLLQVVL